jgi:hypothetical protein
MQFRLRTPHVIEGAVRNPGTIVGPYGSGAPVIFEGDPTSDMEGVDDEGVSRVREVYRRLHGDDPPWHRENYIRPGQEQVYADENHPDNQEYDEEEVADRARELAEANARYHNNMGTMPLETLPHPAATGTMVRPLNADTPQDQAVRPDRPLAQQLPDVQPGAGAGSPNVEQAKKEALAARDRQAPSSPTTAQKPKE